MRTDINRTPRSEGRQSLLYQDLATPITSRRTGTRFRTPGQEAAVSALWRENLASSDLPPPPAFTLEDKLDVSPDLQIQNSSVSPEMKSDSHSKKLSTPKKRSDATTSYGRMTRTQLHRNQQSPLVNTNWLSPAKSGSSAEKDYQGSGSPVEGLVQPGALITLPPPREVARPEVKKSFLPFGDLDEEEWITIYGFSPADTNLVLGEFEKYGVILKHFPGPKTANWMHILYQHRSDARKAISKNGMELNGILIIGVKPVDQMQRQALNERIQNQEFMPFSSSTEFESNGFETSPFPRYLPNHVSGVNQRSTSGSIAAPGKSMVSKVMDLMFGV